jgi:predicted O-linked N-acetylglucosamine transferase (SPINDLY family)
MPSAGAPRPEDLARLGDDLLARGQFNQALAVLEGALAQAPRMAFAHVARGRALQSLRHDLEALAAYDRAYEIEPGFPYLAGARWRLKLELCDWRNIASDQEELESQVAAGKPASAPFMLLMTERADLARKAAETWLKPYPRGLCPRPPPARDERIRVGYFSGDYRNHAITHLTVGMFERHDRTAFEITGFSFGSDDQSPARARIAAAFDQFIDVRGKNDDEVTAIARARQLDIAVDLTGFTQQGRIGIFSRRAAPVQVNFLGYPGTMGSDFHDYIIADATVVPANERPLYSEKVVTLPDCYQINDDRREIPATTISRRDAGLPDEGFVFCCFNAVSKITPETFDIWTHAIKRTPNSVLWLYSSPGPAIDNLRREASARGIDPSRLVFAGPRPQGEHLARHRLASLFLDTLPYNAHTTASDALWAGLPVLTRKGSTFAGRVAASILEAAGLPELIVSTAQDYEDLAIALASDPARLTSLKEKLAANRTTTPLFDTARFTRRFEAALKAMHARSTAGQAPDHLSIPA